MGFVFKICNEFLDLNMKTNNPIKKWGKNMNNLSKEDILMAN